MEEKRAQRRWSSPSRPTCSTSGARCARSTSNPALQELADEIAALSVQTGGSARQNAHAAQLMMLTQRMAKNANTMLAEAVIDPEVSFLLGKDTNGRDILQGLLQGSEALRIQRVSDPELRGKLARWKPLSRNTRRGREHPRQPAAAGERQARELRAVPGQRGLLGAAENLNSAYEAELGGRRELHRHDRRVVARVRRARAHRQDVP